MRRDRGQQADLFTTGAAFQEGSPPPQAKQSSAQKRRYVLPNDLPNAVKHLDDRELDLLITASLQEAKANWEQVAHRPSVRTHGGFRRTLA
jgi:hypothetical protein